jgi:TfuA protein
MVVDTRSTANVVIFCGPSIAASEARKIVPQAKYLGPIKRGDLDKYDADLYCIIDGLFFQQLAVSPSEIMQVLKSGKSVCGSSSMGALRAAECWRYGMKGYGTIYQNYRNGTLMGDDEVALSVCPVTYRQMTDALVDIRWSLAMAVQQGVVRRVLEEQIIAHCRRTYFAERQYSLCLSDLCDAGLLTSEAVESLLGLYENHPKRKYLDAVQCLEEVQTNYFQ